MHRSTISRVLSHARNLSEAVGMLEALEYLGADEDEEESGRKNEESVGPPEKDEEVDAESSAIVKKQDPSLRGMWADTLVPTSLALSKVFPEIISKTRIELDKDKKPIVVGGTLKEAPKTWLAYSDADKAAGSEHIRWKKIPKGYVLIDPHPLAINGPQNPPVYGFLLRTFLEKDPSPEGDTAVPEGRRPYSDVKDKTGKVIAPGMTPEEKEDVWTFRGGKESIRKGRRIKIHYAKSYMTILYYAKQLPARQAFVLSPYHPQEEGDTEDVRENFRYYRETAIWVSASCLRPILYKIAYTEDRTPLGEGFVPLIPMAKGPDEYNEILTVISKYAGRECGTRALSGMDAMTILGTCLTDAEWQDINSRYSKDPEGGGTPHTHYVVLYEKVSEDPDEYEVHDVSHLLSYRDAHATHARYIAQGFKAEIRERRYVPWQYPRIDLIYDAVDRKIGELNKILDNREGASQAEYSNAVREFGDIREAFYRWLAERYVRAIKLGNMHEGPRKSTVGKNSYRVGWYVGGATARALKKEYIGPDDSEAKQIAGTVRKMLTESCRKIIVRGGAKIEELTTPCVEERMRLLSDIHLNEFGWSLGS